MGDTKGVDCGMKPFNVVIATIWVVLAVAVFAGAIMPSSFGIGLAYLIIAIQHVIISEEGD